jgi:hypothetical protein
VHRHTRAGCGQGLPDCDYQAWPCLGRGTNTQCHARARTAGKLRSPAVTHGHREQLPIWAWPWLTRCVKHTSNQPVTLCALHCRVGLYWDQGGAAARRRWLGVSAALRLRRPARRTPSRRREQPPDQDGPLTSPTGCLLLAPRSWPVTTVTARRQVSTRCVGATVRTAIARKYATVVRKLADDGITSKLQEGSRSSGQHGGPVRARSASHPAHHTVTCGQLTTPLTCDASSTCTRFHS